MNADLVSSTLAARAHEPAGLRKMLLVSGAAHIALVAVMVILPGMFGFISAPPETVMTISLGGAPGPQSGGMTPISGRPVQQVAPTPELPRPQPVRPPAPKPPEMVEPVAKPRPTPPRPPVKQAPEKTAGRTPTTGAETREGRGQTDTGSQSTETGLSTGGGGGGGQISLGDFCDPQYLGRMISLIHQNWNSRQSVVGKPIVRFVIQRNGTLTDISMRQSSGYVVLDMMAQRAVQQTRAIPPLPPCYPHSSFIVNLTFEYIR